MPTMKPNSVTEDRKPILASANCAVQVKDERDVKREFAAGSYPFESSALANKPSQLTELA